MKWRTEIMNSVPTKEEVDERYKERAPYDVFGFEVDEYILYMTVAGMRPILEEGTTDETLKGLQCTPTREEIVADMKKYMVFAFGKANNQRGISASRSIQHYVAWTWLAGDEELSSKVEQMYEDEYMNWGIPILKTICEFYGWDWKIWSEL